MHFVTGPRCRTVVLKRIRWERPLQRRRKLNTDGSALGEHGLAGCGGVIRDAGGHWVAGFSKWFGYTSSFVAELWGLREGLILCYNLNIQLLEIELDAKAIVDVLGNLSYVNNIIYPILDDCRQLITCFQRVRIMHCFRQANWCADELARMSFRMNVDFKTYDSPPMDVLDVFEGDLNGMYFNKICHEPCVSL